MWKEKSRNEKARGKKKEKASNDDTPIQKEFTIKI